MKYIILLVLLVIMVSGCVTPADVKELQGVEIRSYEGGDLSSISEVRDLSIKGPQNIDISTYTLDISGLVDNPQVFSYEEVLANQRYSKVVDLNCVTGWSATILWEGVLVEDLLNDAGIQERANTVIFYAEDGYSTSLPLDFIKDNNIIIAYNINNVTLTPSTGYPFILVAEQKWGYKWIKWITEIEASDDPEFEGYWESRGYSNEAGIDKHYF